MKLKTIALTAIVAWNIAGSASAATLIFSDHFNEGTANDQASNFNNNLGSSQAGTLATTSYTVLGVSNQNAAQHSNSGTQLTVANFPGGGYGNVSLNNNFATQANAADEALQISFTIGAVFGYASSDRWVQFNLGSSQNLAVNNAGASVGVLFRLNGATQTFHAGGQIGSEPTWAANDLVTITLSGTGGVGSAFDGGGSEAAISIGSNSLGTFTLAQQSSAYLTFSAFNFGDDQFGGGISTISVSVSFPSHLLSCWPVSVW